MSLPRLDAATSGVSQIIAVSQEAVNDALYYLFDKHEELRTIHSSSKYGELQADMDTAEVSLLVKKAFDTVMFYCNFRSGTFRLKVGNRQPRNTSIDVTGWRFAFEVKYGKLVVTDTSEIDEVKSKIGQPGEYSIERMFLDFTTNKIIYFDKDHSDFKGHVWDEDDLDIFLGVMRRWGDGKEGTMKDPKLSSFGYCIETQAPETVNIPAPSFPPTALRHQTYPYIGPGKHEPDEGLVTGKANMLLYVEMTQHKEFPTNVPVPYTGNFVEPGMKATACVSSQVFWDSYLLRDPSSTLPCLLQDFNRQLFPWHNSLRAKSDQNDFYLHWNFGFGGSDATSQLARANMDFGWQKLSPTSWGWDCAPEPESGEDSTWWPVYMGMKGTGTGFMKNRIYIEPANNKIILEGSSVLSLDGAYYFTKLHTGTLNKHLIIKWYTEIEMKSVHDGGIEMKMNPATLEEIFKATYNDGTIPCGGEKEPDLPGVPEDWADAFNHINFNSIIDSLTTALRSTSRFVLSGGDVFFYKNPIFNNHGDLLVEATYKG